MEIRLCQNNQGAEAFCKTLRKQFPNLFIKAGACLESCSICNCAPFIKIDDKVVKGESWRQLLEKISSIIDSSNL